MADGHLDIRILGPLEVRRGTTVLPLGGHRQQAVLTCLVVAKGFAVSTDRIVDAIWGEAPPPGHLTTLQTYVYRLREALEPGRQKGVAPQVLVTAGGGYRLEIPEQAVDARRFEQLVVEGQDVEADDPERASALLSEALGLWRAEPLASFADLEPVALETSRLEELHQTALETWAHAELALGHHAKVAPELGRLVAAYPLREQLHGLRMLALYRDGRQTEALSAYRQLHSGLGAELGVEPSPSLRELHSQILRHDPALAWRRPPTDAPAGKRQRQPGAGTMDHAAAETGGSAEPLRPTGRQRWIASVGVVALAAALLGYVVLRVSRADEVTPIPPNAVAMLSANGIDGDAVPVSGTDVALASGAGSVWAVDEDENALRRIDARSRQVVQTFWDVGGSPQSVAVSGNDVWVAGYAQGVVKRFNARDNTLVARIPVGANPAAVVAVGDEVWIANSGDDTVQRIDPVTNTAADPVPVGTGPDGLVLDGTTLWVANGRAASVTVLDTRTGEQSESAIPVGDGPRGMAVTATDVWVTNELDQTVTRIARATHDRTTIHVEDGPSSVVLSDGFAWVNNAFSDSVSRIDTGTNAVSRIPLGSAPRALTIADGRIWVATGSFGNVEHRGGTLVFTHPASRLGTTLDPALAYNPPNLSLLRPVYDGLVTFRVTGSLAPRVLVPDLATTLPRPSDGGKTYVFTVRPGIRYSTGAEVIAEDFVRGLRRAVIARANLGYFQKVVGATKCFGTSLIPGEGDPSSGCRLDGGVDADNSTGRVTIRLTEPDPYFLYELAWFVVPTPPGMPLTDVGKHATIPGTGPYQMSAVAPDSSFTLTRNPYFRQWSFAAQPAGYPDRIVYRPVASDEQRLADILAGQADVAFIDPATAAQLAGSEKVTTRQYPLFGTEWAYLNRTAPPFDNRDVRRALNFAVDRRDFIGLYGQGLGGADISCQLLPAGFPGYKPYCPYQTAEGTGDYRGPDLDKARQLVAQSGTKDMPIVVHSFQRVESFKVFADYLAERLKLIGYTHVMVEDIPEELLYDDAGSPAYDTFQIFTQLGWYFDYPDPNTFYDGLFSCVPPNASRYCNTEIEALASQARALTNSDPAQSLKLWTRVDQLLTDDAAFVTLGNPHAAQVFSRKVGNIHFTPALGAVLSQLWVV